MSVPLSTQKPLSQEVESEEQESPKKTSPRWRRWLSLAFRVGCTLLLFGILLRSISWSDLLQNIRTLDDGVLLIGLILGLFGVIVSSYQWQVLLDGERIRVDLRKLINLYLVGIAFSHFLPTGMGGDVVKAYYVGREGKNTAGSASAVVMSRITGFFGMLLISVPALLLWRHIFSGQIVTSYLLACLAMCAAIGFAVLGVAVLPRLIKGSWLQWRIFASVVKVGNALLSSFGRPRILLGSILFGVIFHFAAGLNYYAYGLALHMQVPLAFYLVAIPFVSLIAFLPFSINGFGLREGALVFLFSTVHVPAATALLLALLVDVQVLFCGLLGGVIYLAMGRGSTRVGKIPGGQNVPALE